MRRVRVSRSYIICHESSSQEHCNSLYSLVSPTRTSALHVSASASEYVRSNKKNNTCHWGHCLQLWYTPIQSRERLHGHMVFVSHIFSSLHKPEKTYHPLQAGGYSIQKAPGFISFAKGNHCNARPLLPMSLHRWEWTRLCQGSYVHGNHWTICWTLCYGLCQW